RHRLLVGQYRRQPGRAPYTNSIANITQGTLQHPCIEEHQGIECQILRGSGDLTISREPTEERAYIARTQLQRVAHAMVANEVANPVPVAFFGTDTVMIQPNHRAKLLLKARFGWEMIHWESPCCSFIQ